MLTLAERGSTAMVEGVIEAPAVALAPVDVVDATGAGDAFVAGLLLGLGDEGPRAKPSRWSVALALGNALGAQAVTAVGALTALRPPWSGVLRAALASAATSGDGATR